MVQKEKLRFTIFFDGIGEWVGAWGSAGEVKVISKTAFVVKNKKNKQKNLNLYQVGNQVLWKTKLSF
jgi:hypothetical protein